MSRFKTIFRRTVVLLAVGGTGVALGFGWQQAQSIVVTDVALSGVQHADPDQIRELLALPDSARLFHLDPNILASRAERAPWVRSATVTRWLTGTLQVTVAERRPAVLLIQNGEPTHFLDAEGHAMPATESALQAGYDVPLVTGSLPRILPTQPIEDAALRRLLEALPAPGTFGDALIGAIERGPRGELTLVTAPVPDGAPIRVRLGAEGPADQLRRLEAFWEQIVLAAPEAAPAAIDLRFEDQIVTRSHPAPSPSRLTSTSHE